MRPAAGEELVLLLLLKDLGEISSSEGRRSRKREGPVREESVRLLSVDGLLGGDVLVEDITGRPGCCSLSGGGVGGKRFLLIGGSDCCRVRLMRS